MLLFFFGSANAVAKTFTFAKGIMKHKTQKAVVATVKYAGFEFPGLKLPNGDYSIAIPQIIDLLERDSNGFCPPKTQPQEISNAY